MRCRHCHSTLEDCVLDLRAAPPSNAYIDSHRRALPETWYPLRLMVCRHCWLVQLEENPVAANELFSPDYAYFSSYSSSWLAHCETFVSRVSERFGLDSQSLVMEIAANDGYLLQYVKARGVPCLGVEPTTATAEAARAKGIDIVEAFFGIALARTLKEQYGQADLMVANNVLAHVPDINDFVAAFALLLKPHGVVSFEFQHLLALVNDNQFDTIYHEHYSYLTLAVANRILGNHGLYVFDVEQLPTHGGSLRIYAARIDHHPYEVAPSVAGVLAQEQQGGVETFAFYNAMGARANLAATNLLSFLSDCVKEGKRVMAYGAAAKGNTLFNFAGVTPLLVPCVVDKNPNKQNKLLPGSRIPIVSEERLLDAKPDYVLILPWNLRGEIMQQLAYIRSWGGSFVTAIPELNIQ